MSKSKKIEHDFAERVYASRGKDGDENYKTFHESEQDAIESDEIALEGFDDEVALVAEYKLVRVRRLRVSKTTRVVSA